ncbi:hypothetical protein J5T34_05805 [Cupriavidus gilardii]|uniref:hypothetical protein n=1 Tax=Cupriavidus gilardii TaxID=82541 RepID=UPI001ABEDD93|nr:hypothetical protein [Cupriavidus gilardii]MBO4120253.1 hypothetical protein [Cupriavidus gilardii]
MCRYVFTRECDDGPVISPDYELTVDFELDQGHIAVRGVYARFAGSNDVAKLGDRNYDRGAIESLCRNYLETL